MRRMKRKNPKHKKRHNPPVRRRRVRRNDETAAAPAKKKRKSPPTVQERNAKLFASLVAAGFMTPEVAAQAATVTAPKARGAGKAKGPKKYEQFGFESHKAYLASLREAREAREAEEKAAVARRKEIRGKKKQGITLTADEIALIARGPSKPRSRRMTTGKFREGRRIIEAKRIIAGLEGKYRGPEERTTKKGKVLKTASSRAVAAKYMFMKDNSKATRKIAKAWREVQLAQKLAITPQERGQLRAMGLASVPNPGMGVLKDIGNLLPQIGGAAAGFVGAAVIGQVALKAIPETQKDAGWAKAVPSAVSLTVGALGYAALRMSKNTKVSSVAPYVLAGGALAAVVHAIVRVKVGDQTIAQKLGLPLGEYAAMAGYGEYAAMAGYHRHGMGEYAAMAGGTTYSGEQGIFAGLDDVDPVLSGTDDEDEVDYTETLADEGVNADEGSLNGSIFD